MLLAHIAGIPVEETLLMAAPSLSVFFGVVVAELRSRRTRAAEKRTREEQDDGPSL
jgi:hypothetical protein